MAKEEWSCDGRRWLKSFVLNLCITGNLCAKKAHMGEGGDLLRKLGYVLPIWRSGLRLRCLKTRMAFDPIAAKPHNKGITKQVCRCCHPRTHQA